MNVAEDVRTLRSTLENARAEASRVRADVAEFRETTGGTSEAVARVEVHLSQASVRIAHLEQLASHLADRTGESLARLDERLGNDIVYLKAQLSQHTSRLEQIAAPAGAPKAGAKTRARAASKQESEDDQQLDAFYLAFENEFRGSRDLIQQRLEAYLPFLERAEVSGKRGGILDLGCGRGEWLELLQARGYEQVRGVDLNTSMIEQCRGRGLDVVHADALEHLRALPDASVELVASFHLIEHLPFRALLEFLRHIQRVLLPGGLTILETPNPRNILVGASDFFRDMTHNHPIHPDTIRFTVETIGMADVGCYFLQDEARGRKPIRDTDYVFDDLRSYVDVPRDYAVIARKT
jgi:O-antigen chain-terminating methyltransferase